ncbi:phospholipase A2 inhibitor and Ly6/PLAUR domain-containing protein-like [Lissotriton helveticus]
MRALLAAVTMLQALITGGTHVILTAFKYCLDPSHKAACGREFSSNAPAFSLWTSRACCDSDFCNSGDVKVSIPPPDGTPNGYICGGCTSNQSAKPCTATVDVQCTGNQNACGTFYGTVFRPGEAGIPYSGKGCTTQDSCKVGIFNLAATQTSDYGLKCSPALKV